jgi:hypothetical protein
MRSDFVYNVDAQMTFSYKCSCAGDELSVILNSQAIAAAQTLIRLLGPEFTSYQQVK